MDTRQRWLMLVLPILLAAGPVTQSSQEVASQAERWVAVVCSEEAVPPQERERAEKALAQLPPEQVLPSLLNSWRYSPAEELSSPRRTAEAESPPSRLWDAVQSEMRVRKEIQRQLGMEAYGRLLLKCLQDVQNEPGLVAVTTHFRRNWLPEAQEPLCRLLRDATRSPRVRFAAAEALLVRAKGACNAEIIDMIERDMENGGYLVSTLINCASRERPDPAVLCLAGHYLQRYAKPTENPLEIMWVVTGLMNYLHVSFEPPKLLAKMMDSDQRRSYMVNAALRWWKANAERYEAEAKRAAATQPAAAE